MQVKCSFIKMGLATLCASALTALVTSTPPKDETRASYLDAAEKTQAIEDVCSSVTVELLENRVSGDRLLELGALLVEFVQSSEARFEGAAVKMPMPGLGNLRIERYTSENLQFCYTVEIPLVAALREQGLGGTSEMSLAFLLGTSGQVIACTAVAQSDVLQDSGAFKILNVEPVKTGAAVIVAVDGSSWRPLVSSATRTPEGIAWKNSIGPTEKLVTDQSACLKGAVASHVAEMLYSIAEGHCPTQKLQSRNADAEKHG